jgi:hypothetical protein
MCLKFGFVIFWQKDFGAKAAHKMLVKLTPGVTFTARVTRTLVKNCQIFQKIAQKVAKSKNAKISITKHNLKAQNIYNKPLLKP